MQLTVRADKTSDEDIIVVEFKPIRLKDVHLQQ